MGILGRPEDNDDGGAIMIGGGEERRRWRGTSTSERRQRRRGSKEDNKANKMTHMGQQRNSPIARSRIQAVAKIGDEGGGGDFGTLRGQRGEHHIEHDEANPTVATARTKRHGW